jgi:hypothetical protein
LVPTSATITDATLFRTAGAVVPTGSINPTTATQIKLYSIGMYPPTREWEDMDERIEGWETRARRDIGGEKGRIDKENSCSIY